MQRYPHELSGGQCQRVLIAMAFAGEPSWWWRTSRPRRSMSMTQARIVRLIAEQQAAHHTALSVHHHDLRLAGHVCRNVGVMYAGDMVEYGPAAAVLEGAVASLYQEFAGGDAGTDRSAPRAAGAVGSACRASAASPVWPVAVSRRAAR